MYLTLLNTDSKLKITAEQMISSNMAPLQKNIYIFYIYFSFRYFTSWKVLKVKLRMYTFIISPTCSNITVFLVHMKDFII